LKIVILKAGHSLDFSCDSVAHYSVHCALIFRTSRYDVESTGSSLETGPEDHGLPLPYGTKFSINA